jgi:hypothetical protein
MKNKTKCGKIKKIIVVIGTPIKQENGNKFIIYLEAKVYHHFIIN